MLDVLLGSAAEPAGVGLASVLLIAGVFALRRGEAARQDADPAEGGAQAKSLDAAAAVELHRARRYGRPLTVISLTTRGTEDAAQLASDLRLNARVNDVVGFLGRSTIVGVLPETAAPEAAWLVRRLADLVDEDVAVGAVAGIATFPCDEVTWIGLCERAQRAAQPLAVFRGLRGLADELARDLRPVGTAELESESGLAAPAAAHIADPAA